jgi:c-di-GMP-binding flagellar brake protein YcgR
LDRAVDRGQGQIVERERRQHRRFQADNSAFAIFRPGFNKWGKIKDISESGLAVEYVTAETYEEAPSSIDIFTSQDHFYLPKVPCRIVYDTTLFELQAVTQGASQKRRCGLQFKELNEHQRSEIQFFLSRHTRGPVL